VETQLRGRAIADLADAPTVSDPKVQAIMSLIAVSLSPAYMAQRQHFPLLAAMGVNACLRQGNTAESSSVYNSYALVRAGAGDFGSALQFSDVALRLLAKSNDPVTRGVLLFRHGFFINHWRNHVATSLPYLQESFSASMAAGNLLYAGYARFAAVETSIEKGDPLDEVLRVSREYAEFAKGTRNDATCDTLRVQQRFVACLKGWTRELACSDDRALADQAQLSGFAVWRYHVLKQMVSFLFGRYDEALESAEQAAEALRGVVALLLVGTHHFYRALVLAAVYPGTDATRREGLKRELAEELRIHREWADNCPDNFANRYALVSAEVARIEGREVDAERLYEQAIRSARDNDFVQNEALAYELASNFYRARGYAEVADLYLRDARDCYERWGADGKVKQLEGLYPHLIELRPPGRTPTFTARPEQLDLLAVVKASQTISGEIEVERLLGTLLQVVLEQGGARRGCLVLERDGALFVEAEASIEEKGMVTRILPSLEMDSSLLLPVSVVQHSRVTRQPVILEDAAADPGKFASDVYFSRHRTRSVLCLPILRQAELVGLVYLENRYIAGAFTPDRLTTLSLLASQAAISLESARFVHEERQTRQRLTVLAEAGALLSESLDYHQTLKRLCRLCVESLADWCVLDLLDGREVHRLAGACADPAKELFLEQLRQRHPARWDSPHPAAQCLRSGNAILLPEITDEAQKDLCEDEDHLKLILALPTRSVMAVPLITRGQTLGVLTMASATPRRYGKADLELAQELTQRAASAIELERELKERKKIQEELLERVEMAALTADVGMAMTKGDTLQATLQRCAEAIVSHLGAAFARIWIHGPEQGVLVLQASAGRYTRIQGTCGRVRIGEFKIGKIAEERRAHLTNDISSDVLIDQEWARREGLVSFAGHPLLTGGKLVGVMAMFADRPLGEVALKALAAIADAVAVAIQRGLAETARASLEEQFRQAQKLESVGRLAGGIAHDFNNLLTVILAGAEMLKQDLGGGSSPAFPMVEEIASAGMRARDLTRQLLAFARRQVISPVPLDLNVLVRNEEKLLHRVLGEDVELVTKLEPSLWSVRCDPGQIEQVILNLAVNSRDAMPKGGTLEIETSNFEVDARDPPLFSGVEPGPFVRLAIRDSGVGMSQEVKSHLFEPFFTTKPAGKGTGLGLATVYGIVEQSAGFIRVDSEPGRGTTFEVLFPRTSDVAIAGAAPVPRASAKGHESILVVEDDPEVRAVTVRSLRAGGYEVLAAGAAQQALDIVNRESKRFHLLVTDVVMPGQDGRSLAEELRRLHPTMRVLYVSGHPEEVIAKRGVLDAGIELLLKPFTPSSLLARVREVLDAR
jgi:signal transduction histidine kinase/CheY-like chemotaxis protein/tetratricopeptide (TPR) repeat protein